MAASVPVSIAVVRARERMKLPPLAAAGLAAGSPLAFWLSAKPRRLRWAGSWALQMWAYKVLFELPFGDPPALRRRLRIDYPIAIDRILGAGLPVPQRIQRALRDPTRISVLDRSVVLLYLTWELEPHLALCWLLLRRPNRFPRAATMLGATIDLTLIGYWLLPTAPPWWASQVANRMDRQVHRVFTETRRVARHRPQQTGHDGRGANPWAAMPSDHFASAAMVAMLLGDESAAAGRLGWLYAIVLALALIYLGEHYAGDILAGGLLAAGVRAAEPVAAPVLGTAATELVRLSRALA